MKLISHRGNVDGTHSKLENKPSYILDTLNGGYDVEIDVWYDSGYWLGHDKPIYKIDESFLENNHIWCHAKNSEAMSMMNSNQNIHSFWHQKDDYTLTSNGFIWTYPGKELHTNSICVLPELGYLGNINQCYGICSDFISNYTTIK